MDFTQLSIQVEKIQNLLQAQAHKTVNQLLVIRNWLIGHYIVEYEQNGNDRAKYGAETLKELAKELKNRKLIGLSLSNLKLFRQLYVTYPQLRIPIESQFSVYLLSIQPSDIQVIEIRQPLAGESVSLQSKDNQTIEKSQPVAGFSEEVQFNEIHLIEKSQPLAGEFITLPELLLNHFSFRHFTELLSISDANKRYFYEQETIKCHWNARQLGRQIETLCYERLWKSKQKHEMLAELPKGSFTDLVRQSLKDPMIFEFTGFKELPKYSENALETALRNKIEDFILELGHGFCFEARQKRITVDGENDRIDLVFYHRVLKCHVLIDLKIKKFRKEYVGQMIYYLNYYRENMMTDGDNPPVGIILCTDKNETKVKYATTGLDNSVFVSKYMLELPSEKDFEKLLKSEL